MNNYLLMVRGTGRNCRGVAQFGLERYLGVVEVAGSNPVTPTIRPFALDESVG